ncbi:hypothetical protein SNEBB_004578 [Seison nebaliae]|nr:hypothetical protein SNEBB_004578 [Seison nebaliae]
MTGGVEISTPLNASYMWENYRTTIIEDSRLTLVNPKFPVAPFVAIYKGDGSLVKINNPRSYGNYAFYGICETIVSKVKSNHFRIMRTNGQDMRSLIRDTIVELNGIMMENFEVSPEYIDGEKFNPHTFKYVDLI